MRIFVFIPVSPFKTRPSRREGANSTRHNGPDGSREWLSLPPGFVPCADRTQAHWPCLVAPDAPTDHEHATARRSAGFHAMTMREPSGIDMVHTGYDPARPCRAFHRHRGVRLLHRPRPGRPRPRGRQGAAMALGRGGLGRDGRRYLGDALRWHAGLRDGHAAAYDLGITVASLVLAIAATGAAFAWVSRPKAGPGDVLVSGPLMGIGVAGMHYTGMAAMRVPGTSPTACPLSPYQSPSRSLRRPPRCGSPFVRTSVWQKLAAAAVMGLAVAGMHYTGMAAATFTAEEAGAHAAHATGVGVGQQHSTSRSSWPGRPS